MKEVWAELVKVEQKISRALAIASASELLLVMDPPKAATTTYDAAFKLGGL